jgi:hypothetical protein
VSRLAQAAFLLIVAIGITAIAVVLVIHTDVA